MKFDVENSPAIVVLSPSALPLAEKIKEISKGKIHGASKRLVECDVSFDNAGEHLRRLYGQGRTIIALMAVGAVVRLLAPVLVDKKSEPPVIAVAEDGSCVVPVLGGHRSGNQIARFLAEALDTHAAITTAGDLRFGVALDAPPKGYVLANPQNVKTAMADLVAGSTASLEGNAPWLEQSKIPFEDRAPIKLTVSEQQVSPSNLELIYHPKTLVLGMGCERSVDAPEAIELAEQALAKGGFSPQSLAMVTSIDVKADEVAIHAVADHFSVPARFFDAVTLEAEVHRLANPSDIVFAEVGCHGVAEGASLAAVGNKGTLEIEKMKSKRVTAAIAKAPLPLDAGHVGKPQGQLFVVGIGPGSDEWRSPEVSQMIGRSTDLVGYSLYLDLLGSLTDGKIRHDFDLGREEDRVRHAVELAGKGKSVALVCSGDAGIYAMATLVFELLDKGNVSPQARRIAIEVSPGISALQAAAARAGAPLGHDFCTLSLSDLLTPWEVIQKRIKAAAEGDFVIAFYNPVSRRRRTQLAYARDVLLQHRPNDTPVILATNLGREGELVRVVPLGQLNIDDVDMLTVVIVGSSTTATVETGDGRTWVYTPRGYAAKETSGIAASGSNS